MGKDSIKTQPEEQLKNIDVLNQAKIAELRTKKDFRTHGFACPWHPQQAGVMIYVIIQVVTVFGMIIL